jgi:type II secretory pathway pseudopilin PulG
MDASKYRLMQSFLFSDLLVRVMDGYIKPKIEQGDLPIQWFVLAGMPLFRYLQGASGDKTCGDGVRTEVRDKQEWVKIVNKITRNLGMKKCNEPVVQRDRSCAFTVIEVLVAVAVIAILIAVMLPTISLVQESARKVVCASNTRQIGIGLNMFAGDNKEMLPPSVFLPSSRLAKRAAQQPRPELMDIVRTSSNEFGAGSWGSNWDGIGLLYSMEYLNAPGIYYCPSQRGTHAEAQYEDKWGIDGKAEIVSNFQFRGLGPNDEQRLYLIASKAAIVTDTMRSYEDLNHLTGFNVLQAGLSVSWSEGAGSQQIIDLLLRGGDDDKSASTNRAWANLDGTDDLPDELPEN